MKTSTNELKRRNGTKDERLLLCWLSPILTALWISGCLLQPHRVISRPSIAHSTDWQLVDESPYVYGGIAKGDHLVGHGLKIRIEALNSNQSPRLPQLVIRFEFLIADGIPIEFIPSLNIVELNTRQSSYATGYECRAALLIDPVYRKSQRPIREIMFSEKY